MDSATLRILYVFTDLVTPLIVGYILHRRGLVSDQTVNKVIKFNVIFVYTLLALMSFWVLPISWGLLLVPVFGFLLISVPGAIGYFCFARRMENLLDRGAYIASAMLANLGTLGGVCAFILYNEQGFAYSQLIGTCQNIMLCLVVFPLAQYYSRLASGRAGSHRGSSPLRRFYDMFFSINQLSLIGMVVGFALNVGGVERPQALGDIFQYLVHVAAWIGMLPVGFLINLGEVKHYAKKVRSLTLLRFVITPVIFVALTKMLVTDPALAGTLIIMAFCPTAINAVLSSRIYHLTTPLAVSSFVITTTAFLLVIFPVIFFVLK